MTQESSRATPQEAQTTLRQPAYGAARGAPAPDMSSSGTSDPYVGTPSRPRGSTRLVPRRQLDLAAWVLLPPGALLAAWYILSLVQPAAIVPGPVDVWDTFASAWSNGSFVPAAGATSEEAGLGWALGTLIALPLGYAVGRWRPLELALAPYLASSQAMPIVAIAPLLVVWLGFGLTPKVMVAALIAFFPVMTTTASGLRAIERDLRDVARVFGASWWQSLMYLDLPLAAHSIFAGAKIGAALSVTGAVVGEFINPDAGLGSLILLGQQNFETSLMFVAVIALMLLGATGYALLTIIERVVLRWEK